MVGEVFVNSERTTGLKMTTGVLQVQALAEAQEVRLASLEPVFIPTRPTSPGPLFSSDAPSASAAGAKGVFTPKGESIGYLQTDGRLIVQPGFTADLTRPFPQDGPPSDGHYPAGTESDAMPLFDVNGKYLGYLNGSDFYPQERVAQAFQGGTSRSGAQRAADFQHKTSSGWERSSAQAGPSWGWGFQVYSFDDGGRLPHRRLRFFLCLSVN